MFARRPKNSMMWSGPSVTRSSPTPPTSMPMAAQRIGLLGPNTISALTYPSRGNQPRSLFQLRYPDDERPMHKRDTERLPEGEDAKQEGPESTPNEGDEEVLPEVPRPVLPASKQPKAVNHPDEPVAGVAHHEAEEDWECEHQDKGRIDLAVIRRREELHEHLEGAERLRLQQQDGQT